MFLVIVTYLTISIIDLPALIKQKDKSAIIVFSILVCAGLVLGYILANNIEVLSPIEWITHIFEKYNIGYKN